MEEETKFSLSTNESAVARLAIAWEITKKMISDNQTIDTGRIRPDHYVDTFNYVFRNIYKEGLIDKNEFEQLLTKK